MLTTATKGEEDVVEVVGLAEDVIIRTALVDGLRLTNGKA